MDRLAASRENRYSSRGKRGHHHRRLRLKRGQFSEPMQTSQAYETLDFQYSMIESSVYLRLLEFYTVVNILIDISQQPSSPYAKRAITLLSVLRDIEKRLRRFGYSLDTEQGTLLSDIKMRTNTLSSSSSRVDSLHRFTSAELGLRCPVSDWFRGHLLVEREMC